MTRSADAARRSAGVAARRAALLAALWGVAAAGSGAAGSSPRSPAEVTDFRVQNGVQTQARAALLQDGEAALRRGETAAALDAFDRAASMLHAGDTEMLQVRAQLQAGRYREALAFCAHTVGAHRELAAPAALYAWLLQAGGQPTVARQVLIEAQTRLPSDPLLTATADALNTASPVASVGLLESPQRLAPEALALDGRPLPDAARIASSGLLIGGGTRALAPLDAVSSADRIWVRNGLGQTVEARIDRSFANPHVALLTLAQPLAPPAGFGTVQREPFAGSVGYVVEYSVADYRIGDPAEGNPASRRTPDGAAAPAGGPQAAAPAWPWLHLGFFAAMPADLGPRRLGISVPPGPHGGPVFDAAGRLAGLALTDGMLLPISALPALSFDGPEGPAPAGALPRVAADEIYERALRIALQVIVER